MDRSRQLPLILAAIAALAASPALAQVAASGGGTNPTSNAASNIGPSDTRSPVAPALPPPPVGPNASPRELLAAARGALAAGRTGEAQQAMEMAETRLLDRSVPIGTTGVPDSSPEIALVSQARQALGRGDRAASLGLLDQALARVR